MALGEFDLIGRISEMFPTPEGITGIGDDCAILPQRDGMETLVTTDMLMDGVHFLISDASPYDLGWKSAAVNISDIAAMGGRPVGTFLSYALPKGTSDEWMLEFMRGYKDLSDLSGTPLLGGDTTSSLDRLCINVTVLGECPRGHARKRSDARPGDLICVTGPLGDSAAGLSVILNDVERGETESALVRRHYRPVPRVSEGLILSQTEGVHAMMDISDGIGSDLLHILDASHVGARVDVGSIPLSDECKAAASRHAWDTRKLSIDGGEDYELLFTMAPGTVPATRHFVIGEITEGPGVEWSDHADHLGFRHF